jgi:uncharacterized protein YxeA
MKNIVINIIKSAIYVVLAFLAVSCLNMGSDKYYVNFTGPVEIAHATIPDSATVMSVSHILVTAKASDGCWSNLKFTLTKERSFEYSVEAFGTYESTGTCPPGMVTADTSIVFQPAETGLYKFYIIKGQYDTEIDTMIVR